MQNSSLTHRLAVCSWSLQPTNPRDLIARLEATGIRRVQLALDPLRESPDAWGETAALFRENGITVVSGMFGCVGEDYSTLETIRLTGGIAPDSTWEQNWKNIQVTASLAGKLGLKLVTFHAGFLPHEQKDSNYAKLQKRLAQMADVFHERGIALELETGQETAAVLLNFLQELERPNVGVNFDPANMLLYDKDNPLEALRLLGPWIRQVHIKDARRTKVPGTWGEEVVVGTGEVDWPAFFATLDQIGFNGNLCIEREAGNQRVNDIQAARKFIETNCLVSALAKPKVNVAVVGLGFMGVTHLKAYRQIKAARIVAVCDAVRLPVNGVLAGVSGNISSSDAVHLGRGVRVYRHLDDMLADAEVELVDLCVPTPLHTPQSIAALRAGKHVICEKPLARTSVQARGIVAAAQSAKGFFLPAMCMRFWPGWAWLKELAAKETYGRILAARFRRVSAPPAWSRESYFNGRESGGALLDLHIHDSDFVQFLFGRPSSVFSTGLSRFSGAIDHVVTQYEVPGGATVYAEGSWLLTSGFSMAYTVNFERAALDFDGARGAEALRVDEEGHSPRVIKCKGPDGYVAELRHMIEAIQTGTPPTVVTAQDGLSAVEICEAEEKSVKTGRPVRVKRADA